MAASEGQMFRPGMKKRVESESEHVRCGLWLKTPNFDINKITFYDEHFRLTESAAMTIKCIRTPKQLAVFKYPNSCIRTPQLGYLNTPAVVLQYPS